ncbi:MAG: hypothetical protein RIR11_1130 [Bacteroidota bacterium]|jgi:hypothetical protein
MDVWEYYTPPKNDRILGLNNGKKEYAYPFEFTYWVSNGIFFEHHLLE